jgi:hypothetical protein
VDTNEVLVPSWARWSSDSPSEVILGGVVVKIVPQKSQNEKIHVASVLMWAGSTDKACWARCTR